MPSNLRVDLRLIARLHPIVARDENPSSESTKQQLRSIYDRIHRALSRTGTTAEEQRLLPDFLNLHPDMLAELVIAVVRDTIAYVELVGQSYAEIKEKRPLTADEKQIGTELTAYLAEAQALLDRLR